VTPHHEQKCAFEPSSLESQNSRAVGELPDDVVNEAAIGSEAIGRAAPQPMHAGEFPAPVRMTGFC
jgi:hypothetical protein